MVTYVLLSAVVLVWVLASVPALVAFTALGVRLLKSVRLTATNVRGNTRPAGFGSLAVAN